MHKLLLLLGSITILGLAGCAPPAEEPAVPTEPAEPPTRVAWQDCENPDWGYRITYPPDWHTNEGDPQVPGCSLFDPEPVEVDLDEPEIPADLAVVITVDPVVFDEAAAEQALGQEITSREEMTVDGRTAARVEAELTEDLLWPEGTQVTRWVVDLNGESLIATSTDIGEPAYNEKQIILDDMMQSLVLTGEVGQADPADDGPEPVAEPSFDEQQGDEDTDLGREQAELTDVRIASQERFDRVVLEFTGTEEPGWTVAWEAPPITTDPAGEETEVAGEAFLRVSASPATAVDLTGDEPEPTYDGPDSIQVNGQIVTEVVLVTDHHGALAWVIGLDAQAQFAAAFLDDPMRLVVDIVAEG